MPPFPYTPFLLHTTHRSEKGGKERSRGDASGGSVFRFLLGAALLFFTAGCTASRRVNNCIAGALIGAGVGAVTGGNNHEHSDNAMLGTGIGAVVGGPRVSLDENGYKQRLSERRAQSVKASLVSKGVAASRLDTVGRGEQDPVAPNTKDGKDNPEGRAINRRADLKAL